MESVEGTGRTVDDAIENALDELDLEREDVEVTVLSEGGDQPARVLVTVREDLEELDEVDEEVDEPPRTSGEQYPRATESPSGRGARSEAAVGTIEADARPAAELAAAVLEEMLEQMDLPSDVQIESAFVDEDATSSAGNRLGPLPTVQLSIHGEFGGILIGRHGETLGAIQFLLGLIASRRAGRRVRVTVDAEGYRERREKLLRDMAIRAADRAQRYRQPIFMDPMLPGERRIIHLTLADHPNVSTHSIGEGDSRRVVVSPRQAQRFGGYSAP